MLVVVDSTHFIHTVLGFDRWNAGTIKFIPVHQIMGQQLNTWVVNHPTCSLQLITEHNCQFMAKEKSLRTEEKILYNFLGCIRLEKFGFILYIVSILAMCFI